jgi:hypothetical protein
VLEGVEDALDRELIKDLCLARALRHDIFVRGPNRLAGADLRQSLHEITLALAVDAPEFSYEIEMAKGSAQLSRDFYAPVVAALARGPQEVGALLSLAQIKADRPHDPAEVLGILVGGGQTLPVLRPGAPLSKEAKALNQMIAAAFGRVDHRGAKLALASTALGAGLPTDGFDLFVQHRADLGEDGRSLNVWVDQLGAGLEPEGKDRLRALLSRALSRRSIFPAAGLV